MLINNLAQLGPNQEEIWLVTWLTLVPKLVLVFWSKQYNSDFLFFKFSWNFLSLSIPFPTLFVTLYYFSSLSSHTHNWEQREREREEQRLKMIDSDCFSYHISLVWTPVCLPPSLFSFILISTILLLFIMTYHKGYHHFRQLLIFEEMGCS